MMVRRAPRSFRPAKSSELEFSLERTYISIFLIGCCTTCRWFIHFRRCLLRFIRSTCVSSSSSSSWRAFSASRRSALFLSTTVHDKHENSEVGNQRQQDLEFFFEFSYFKNVLKEGLTCAIITAIPASTLFLCDGCLL